MYIVYEYVNVNWFSYWNILLRCVSGSHICLHYIVYIHMGIAESQWHCYVKEIWNDKTTDLYIIP